MGKVPIEFLTLFDNPEKISNVTIEAKINSIINLDEMFELSIEAKNNIKFSGFAINKGEIFPSPKKDDIIKIDKIQYKYDKNFQIRFFINAEIISAKEVINTSHMENNIIVDEAISIIDQCLEKVNEPKKSMDNDSEKNNIKMDKTYKSEINFGQQTVDINKPKIDNLLIGININNESKKEQGENKDIKIEESSEKIFKKIDYENSSIINQNNNYDFDFSAANIIKNLKIYLDIKQELLTNLFIVDSVDECYSLKCFENNRKFFLMKKNNYLGNLILNKKDILFINDYYLENNNIKPTQLTIVEKLSDENLFYILQEYAEISKKYLWGKIIDIDLEKNLLILMDNNMKIYEIKNDEEKGKFGQFFLFSKFKIVDEKTNEIEIDKNYFFYFSSQEVYFSKNIKLNEYSVIQFYFKDYIKNINKYNIIQINSDKKKIESNNLYFIIHQKKINNYEIYLQEIVLYHNEIDFKEKKFTVSVLQGFLKKINALINYDNDDSFYYEYLYYSFKNSDFLKTKTIKINDVNEDISIYDDFSSLNRRQFNVLNIPFQKEVIPNENLIKNSFLVCEAFWDDKKPKIYGLFELQEILNIYPSLSIDNKFYDKYYDEFGNIMDYLNKNCLNDNIGTFVDECIIKLAKYFKLFQLFDFLSYSKYEESISLSQLKTRLGIIASYYLYLGKKKQQIKEELNENILKLVEIYKSIMQYKKYLSPNQIIRIFILLTRRKIDLWKESKLLVLTPEASKESPYYEAQEFNLQEIKHLNEFSRLFAGYIQMDSYILFNHILNGDSYSFSMEPLFILQNHLISNYESFLILEDHINDIIAWTESDVQITIINKNNLFEKTNIKNTSIIKDEALRKNHSFGISMVFRHEKNSHQKKNLKNKHLYSPIYYCDEGKEQKYIYEKFEDSNFGDDGIIIESFITQDRGKILSLTKDFIYGDLMNYELFVDKDFKLLEEKIDIAKENNKDYLLSHSSQKTGTILQKKDSMAEFNKKQSHDISEEEIMNIIKHGQVNIGCQCYTINMIKDMILIANNRGRYDYLPKIIKKIDEVLKIKKK